MKLHRLLTHHGHLHLLLQMLIDHALDPHPRHEYWHIRNEKSTKSRIHMLNSNVLRQVAGVAYLRASFTLVSFGPARAMPGAEKMIPPGGYLHPEQTPPPSYVVTRDYARQAASDVVYNELASSVRGNIPLLSVLLILAISPWIEVLSEQRIFVILGAIAALVGASVGPISSWVTLITGIPAMLAILKWLQSRSRKRQKAKS